MITCREKLLEFRSLKLGRMQKLKVFKLEFVRKLTELSLVPH